MPVRANVTSVEAIKEFRSKLIVYVTKARPALEEVSAEVLRTRLWLQDTQRPYWESQIKRRMKVLEEAQQALFSARLGNLREPTAAETAAVTRAKRSLEEAEGKLRITKLWSRDFDNRVEPLAKQLEKLHNILSIDLTKAIASLSETVKTLDAYSEAPPAMGDPIPTSTGSEIPSAATPSADGGGKKEGGAS
jgi:hypothetical protein